ncbi:MAG TPA: translation initiation factor IF-2 [Rhodanobacter sp.]|nr:translation initiation factor IF-2 [Rhodanobacter sp.]
MADMTINKLADAVGMPVDKLLSQLGEAGMKFSDPDQVISSTDKVKLLGFLRRTHGRGATPAAAAAATESTPRQITLRRRTVGELKVSTPGGRGSASTSKTVNVEVRAKRTYVKRSVIAEEAGAEPEREEAARKLAESREQRKQEAIERAAAEQRRLEAAQQRDEQQRKQAEPVAPAPAAEPEAAPVVEDAPKPAAAAPVAVEPSPSPESVPEPAAKPATKAAGKSAGKVAAPKAAVPAPAEPTPATHEQHVVEHVGTDAPATIERLDPRELGMIVPHVYEPRKREKVVKPAAPAPAPVHATPSSGSSDARGKARHGRDRGEAGDGKRFGTGQLHLSEADRAKRSSGKRGRTGRGATREAARGAAAGAHGFTRPTTAVVHEVVVGDANAVSDLAQKMAVKGAEVVKALFKMGVMATINQTIDHDTAVLVVEELGHKVVEANANDAEAVLAAHTQTAELEGEKEPRPPVVTIMGHVDHGKTSLLDFVRRTKVASGEAGGITQHIGAYHVKTSRGVITFLDTPGHAAFTAMRARGAQSTDIVVLVVAADDGVMPQTIEAVEHARAAKVPLIVAMNKMDKPTANPDHVKQELANIQVIPEDWGGDTQFIPVSAKTGQGVEELLEAISVQAEVMELAAVVDGPASGVVIESSLDKGRGPVATVLVQQGTLNRGDFVVCGIEYGRMRALVDETGKRVQSAGPSIPVQVLGLSGVPEAGDDFVAVADEKLAKQVAEERHQKRRETRMVSKANRLEDIMAQMGQGNDQQTLNILVKADVQGSVEALRESLSAIGNENVKVNVIASGVGGITESDATLAAASKALLIGFNVRADASARKVIETSGLDVRYFSIIYDVIDQVKQAASGLLGVEVREEIIGIAEVREVFRSSKFGAVAGCMVTEGHVTRSKPIRVLRDHTVIFEGELESLRRFKDLVDEVRSGMECGIAVKQYNDVKVGDQIECFERTEVARTL